MNGITLWRPDPWYLRRNPVLIRTLDKCLPAPIVPNPSADPRVYTQALKLTANHGEARAGTGPASRGTDRGCTTGSRHQRAQKRLAPGASMESALLRRSRYANRRRRYLVLYGDADRTASFGAAVLNDPQTRRRQHFLVTPVEKVGIRVDDAPFLAVEMTRHDGD